MHAHYAAALRARTALREKLGDLETAAIALRDLGARYELLKNDVDTARPLHASLLKQQMETRSTRELAPSNVRVVERAEVPAAPSKPNVPLNLALGLLGGLAVAVGATFVCEYFDNSVKSSEEVEELLQLPSARDHPELRARAPLRVRPPA